MLEHLIIVPNSIILLGLFSLPRLMPFCHMKLVGGILPISRNYDINYIFHFYQWKMPKSHSLSYLVSVKKINPNVVLTVWWAETNWTVTKAVCQSWSDLLYSLPFEKCTLTKIVPLLFEWTKSTKMNVSRQAEGPETHWFIYLLIYLFIYY